MRLSIFGFLLFAPCLAARADSVIYDVTWSGLLTGTVSIDSTVGTITASDLTVVTPSYTDELTGAGGGTDGRTGYDLISTTVNDAYNLVLTSPNSDGTLKGYIGGNFTLDDANGVADTQGTLVAASAPSSVTPEPGSLWLLAREFSG